jgi:hypothetical protein
MSNLMNILLVGAELFHADLGADGRTDGQTDMTNLIAALRNFANAPKYASDQGHWFCVVLHKIPTVKNKKTPFMFVSAFWLQFARTLTFY